MNNVIHLDFETRSEADISKVGTWNYSMHPSTEILCMAWCYNDEDVQLMVADDISYPGSSDIFDFKDVIFKAHYSMFEYYIWHNILVKRYGWPEIPFKQWRCTAALAASHALPRSLDKASWALQLKERKDMSGKRIMLKMCKPRNPSKYNKNKYFEDPEDYQKLYDYCINDVEVERAIDNALPPLNNVEQEVWFLDQEINMRGIHVDMELVDSALLLAQLYTDKCIAESTSLTDGIKPTQRNKILEWMREEGYNMQDLTADSVREALTMEVRPPPDVRRLLELRQQMSKTSVKKFEKLKSATAEDGRLKDMFVYHGASTGRWSGKVVQLQNLPRGTVKDTETCIEIMKWGDLDSFEFFYPDVMGAISSCIRGALIAAPGKDLLVVDFASIEARVLAWVAGEEGLLNEFKEGEDSYVKMAKAIFNTNEISKSQRFVGKQAVLGCGYGMGAKKFKGTCASLGQEVSEELAKKAVTAFRKKNKKIVGLWRAIEWAATDCVKIASRGLSNVTPKTLCGNIIWSCEGDFLYCTLPSGRRLAYHHPKIERVEKFEQTVDQLTFLGVALGNNYTRQTTWGGTLVENIVQAISRDLLAEAMLRCEASGYTVVGHVHDEIIAEVFGNNSYNSGAELEDFISTVTELPEWADGCPVKAEGWRGKRYRK